MSRNQRESRSDSKHSFRPRDEVDPYKILGIKRNATLDEIKSAYRAAASQYHPDVNQDGEEDFKKISHAFDLLKDPTKRTSYDAAGVDRDDYYEQDWAVWQGYVIPSDPLGTDFNPGTVFVNNDASDTRCPFCGNRVLIGRAKGLFDCGRGHALNVRRQEIQQNKQIERKL